jgi:hypothetical protein
VGQGGDVLVEVAVTDRHDGQGGEGIVVVEVKDMHEGQGGEGLVVVEVKDMHEGQGGEGLVVVEVKIMHEGQGGEGLVWWRLRTCTKDKRTQTTDTEGVATREHNLGTRSLQREGARRSPIPGNEPRGADGRAWHPNITRWISGGAVEEH